MATMNSAQLEPTMIEAVDRVLNKHFEEKRNVTKSIKKSDVGINTRGTRISVYTQGNPSYNWFGEGGSYAPPGTTKDIETKVFPVRCSTGFEFSGTYFRETKSADTLVGELGTYLGRTQASALKKFEQAFCATQTGELGVVLTNDSTVQVTFTITVAGGSMFSNRKLFPGTRVAWYSSAGAQRTTGGTLSIVSEATPPVRSTGVTTFDNVPTDVAATDIAVFGDPTTAGSFNRAITGLQDFVANTGVIQGQSRTINPGLKALVTDASAAAISPTLLRKHKTALMFRSELESSNYVLLTSQAQRDIYERQGLNLIRFQPGAEMRQELKPVFDDMEWKTSNDVHDDRAYFLYMDAFRWNELKPWGRYNEDGMDWRLFFSNGTASDKFTGWMGTEGNFSCNFFNVHVLIRNLAVPTDAALGYLSVE